MKSRSQRTDLKRKIAEAVLIEMENASRASISPVTGSTFQDLSETYKQKKKKLGKGDDADLHLFGDMFNSIKANIKSDGVEFKITDSTQKKKAYNHNVGDTLPRRPFMPDDSKSRGKYSNFNNDIKNVINGIVKEFLEENEQ